MSLDISLTHRETGESHDMNWLRNPFGLERWAEHNYRYAVRGQPATALPDGSLWHVINDHAYDDSANVDRAEFLAVVRAYADVLNQLDTGYFWFDVGEYMQLVQPHMELMPRDTDAFLASVLDGGIRIEGGVYRQHLLGLPQTYFAAPAFHLNGDRYGPADRHTLAHYQAWFAELVDFADLLQDAGFEFYCSN